MKLSKRLNQKGAIDITFIAVLILVLGLSYIVFTKVTETNDTVNQTAVNTETGSTVQTQDKDSEGMDKDEDKDSNNETDQNGNVPQGWVEFSSTKHDLSFQHPSEATVEERQDTNYYQYKVSKDDGSNPNNHFFGDGNYKIEIHLYENVALNDFISNSIDGDVSEVMNNNGINSFTSISNDPTFPGLTTYFQEKEGTLISIFPWGDLDEDSIQSFVDSVDLSVDT